MTFDFNSHSTLSDRFVNLIDAAIDNVQERRREYLGGSAIGEPCTRRLQFEYLDAPKDEAPGSPRAPVGSSTEATRARNG